MPITKADVLAASSIFPAPRMRRPEFAVEPSEAAPGNAIVTIMTHRTPSSERDPLRIGQPAGRPAEHERQRRMAELIGACAAGDRPAFRRLYDLSSRFVCGIILAILRDNEMAAEVAQEVYVSIWQRAGSFDDETRNPLAWIAAIARNRAIDRLRAERARGFIAATDELPDIAGDYPPAGLLVEAVAARRALADLRPEFRRALLLSYFKGYTHTELAGALDVPVGTAKSWVRRGLAALKEALE
jgi:RNA polymerase sigma-70 factor, ECF subfamily